MIDINMDTLSVVIDLLFLFFGVSGIVFLIKRKELFGLIFWLSSVLNFYFYTYFMGKYAFYPKIYYVIINKYWPWINLGLLALVVLNFVRNKQKNKLIL